MFPAENLSNIIKTIRINKFCKNCRIPDNYQFKNQLYFYTLAMKNSKESKKTILFIITSNIIKCLGISLVKEIQDFYTGVKNKNIKKYC